MIVSRDKLQGNADAFFRERPYLVKMARRALSVPCSRASAFIDASAQQLFQIAIETSPENNKAVVEARPFENHLGLTPRQIVVATHVAAGLTNPQIADKLHVSRRTVATHLEAVFDKFEATTRAGVATTVAEYNLYALPVDPVTAESLPLYLRRLLSENQRAVGRLPSLKLRPIRVGAIYPDSVADDRHFAAMQNGFKLGIDALNRMGGVAGRPVEPAVRAVSDEPYTLEIAARELNDTDCDAIVLGNFSLASAISAIRASSHSSAPILHAMTAPQISELVSSDRRMQNVFQVCATETTYYSGFFRSLRSVSDRPERIVAILRSSTHREQHATLFNRLSERYGHKLIAIEVVDDNDPPWGAILRRVESESPSALFLSYFPDVPLNEFLVRSADLRKTTKTFLSWSPSAPDFIARFGGLSDNLFWSTLIGVQPADPLGAEFSRAYEQHYQSSPGIGGAAVHNDFVTLLAQGWQAGGRPWNFDAVVRHLKSRPHRGIAGTYFFNGPGQRGISYPDETLNSTLALNHSVYRISNGRHHLIRGSLR
ncbi:ABC transporter substrate-binding protein [Brevibacterium zhoupengii]|uniref:ABC transporter substrate-binding protein n=1 Tax=Brevibacterium zhoupengii TaxID=2898795 RepID=UPI001E323290|nr:ABC transporter substrate-binding protein [Brevibacterium zhoupengii]